MDKNTNRNVLCCLNGEYTSVEKMFNCDEKELESYLDGYFPDLNPTSIFMMRTEIRSLSDVTETLIFQLNSHRRASVPTFRNDIGCVSVDLKNSIIFITTDKQKPFDNFVLYSPNGIKVELNI